MSEVYKAILREYLTTYNAGEWDDLADFCTADYRHHTNDVSLTSDQVARGAEWIRSGLEGFRVEVDDLVSEGDRVVVRFTGRGRHTGSLYGESPTATDVTITGITIYRFEDGAIAEDWEAVDEHDLRQQVGAAPAG